MNNDLLEEFKERKISSKKDVLENIEDYKKGIKEYQMIDDEASDAYYKTLLDLLDKFYVKVEQAELMDLDGFWLYQVSFNHQSVLLELDLVEFGMDVIGNLNLSYKARYKLIEAKSRLISSEEFANKYGVDQSTVRQWIRRGKIRTAVRYYDGWKIPELTERPRKGYEKAIYKWEVELQDLSKEFNCLNSYKKIFIEQDNYEKSKYHIFLYKDSAQSIMKPDFKTTITKSQVEKLEAYLLANHNVKYIDENNELISKIVQYVSSKKDMRR